MFGRREEPKKNRFLPFLLLRLSLSVLMLAIMVYGGYRALVYFSGVDPIHIDPKALVLSSVRVETVQSLGKSLLGVDIPVNLAQLKLFLQNRGQVAGTSTQIVIPSENNLVASSSADAQVLFSFAVVADSHNDNAHLRQALQIAKERQARFVVGLGDYTQVGTLTELNSSKQVFDNAGLPYYLTAGDHDLWDSRDKGLPAIANFQKIFGPPFQSFGYQDIRFVIVYNSDNYHGIDDLQQKWLDQELNKDSELHPKLLFILLHEPLYHPSSDHIMGKSSRKLELQAENLLSKLTQVGVSEVITGDTHFFSSYQDPKTGVKITNAGAVTEERNTQKPRFLMVDVLVNGSYNIQDVEI